MTDEREKQMAELLKRHVPPIRRELRTDLWPRMLYRIEEHPRSKMGWPEWVLLSLLALLLLTIPEAIPLLLYQL
jgi:hypothetical protein